MVLFEGGEHGRLAARLATQVIKAYVDKKKRQPNQVVQTETGRPMAAVPTQALPGPAAQTIAWASGSNIGSTTGSSTGSSTGTDMASLWTEPSAEAGEAGEQRLQAGTFRVPEGKVRSQPVKAAPGLPGTRN